MYVIKESISLSITSFFILFFFTLSYFVPFHKAYADINHSVQIQSIANSGYSSKAVNNKKDFSSHWPFSGLARIAYSLDSLGNKTVKGGVKFAFTGTSSQGFLFEIERAYIRTRVPLSSNYKFQLELGKNALSWGEGYFYNAGDVIFGITPKSTGFGQNADSFRNYSLWQLRLFFPLSTFAYIETVIGVPEQVLPFTQATTASSANSSATVGILLPTTINDAGVGIRTHFELGLTQWETGLYSHIVNKDISPYFSFVLPMIVKWYIVSSVTFTFTDDFNTNKNQDYRKQFEETAAISTGFLYTTSFDSGGTLDFRTEMMYQNKSFFTNIVTTYFINRVIGIQFNNTLNFTDFEYSFLLGPQWIPADGFSLSLLSSTNFKANPNKSKKDNYVYAGASLVLSYKF